MMTSKERILAALRCEPVDRVPCDPWFFGSYVAALGRQLPARELLHYLTRELGADEFGVPTVAHVGMGLTLLIQLMGGQRAAIASIEEPELVERFLDVEHATNLAMIEVYLKAGVDIICRNGFYETCDFWSPRQVKEFVLPRVNAEARFTHSLGGLLTYTVCTGIEPLLDLYVESEIDCIQKFETKLTGQTLAPIARKLGGRKCLWGGLSDCVDLGQATPDETRDAVRAAFDLVGRRGFILAASPSVKSQRPVENVQAMFEAWRESC